MFDLGIQELIVIFVVALIVFGPKRLPELGKTLGKGLFELKKAMEGIKEQIHEETESVHTPTNVLTSQEEKKDEASGRPESPYPPFQDASGHGEQSTEGDVSAASEGERANHATDQGQERKEDTVNGR